MDDVKGQLSSEFIIVFAGLLVIVATITVPTYNQTRLDAEKINKLSEARIAATSLANALNNIYANGPGSKLVIEYWLPEGVVAVYMGGYENLNVDGVRTRNENIPKNSRADVQVRLDFNNDDIWDNKSEALALVDTILPSRWNENSQDRGAAWVTVNCVHVEEYNLKVGQDNNTLSKRTFHRTTLTYIFDNEYVYPRRILVLDEIVEGV